MGCGASSKYASSGARELERTRLDALLAEALKDIDKEVQKAKDRKAEATADTDEAEGKKAPGFLRNRSCELKFSMNAIIITTIMIDIFGGILISVK